MAALSGSLEEANIDLDVEVDPDLTPLNIDPVIIQRVLVNLLDNALRHTPTDGRILLTARRKGSDVIIRVADSGPGIPAGERDRIFERFRQVKDNIPVRGPKGSGLGLTFCKLAVEAHEGHIWVDTDGPLSGACIALSLPMAAVPTPATVTVPQ
jgi:two-component system sensor histidine kinase KdpD